jgi:hypothetical protein
LPQPEDIILESQGLNMGEHYVHGANGYSQVRVSVTGTMFILNIVILCHVDVCIMLELKFSLVEASVTLC